MDADFIYDLKQSFMVGFIERSFQVYGRRWKLRTLDEEEMLWRDQFIKMLFSTAFLSSRKAPTLAISIKEIDGRKIEEVWLVDQARKAMEMPGVEDNTFNKPKYKAAEAFMDFLKEQPSSVVDRLFECYQEIEEESKNKLSELLKSDETKEQEESEEEKQETQPVVSQQELANGSPEGTV